MCVEFVPSVVYGGIGKEHSGVVVAMKKTGSSSGHVIWVAGGSVISD